MINIDSTIKDIKKDFFSFRNGMAVDVLKKLYPKGVIIFGLNVPQFTEISKKYPKDLRLGLKLWSDRGCRESRLLSLYLLPYDQLEIGTVKDMVRDVQSSEEAEFLAFRILRHLSYATKLYKELLSSSIDDPVCKYCVEMFGKNIQLRSK